MSAIDERFVQLRQAGQKCLIPFVTAGDPDLDLTLAVIEEFAKRGCGVCEVGVPYSDPIADGPVIQASYTRALNNRISLSDILSRLRSRDRTLEMPLATMVSYAIVLRRGMQEFVAAAQDAGVAGAIIPDLPVDESDAMASICRSRDFSLMQLVTPTTPRDRARRIADSSSGFLYYVSVTGITGERRDLPSELIDNVAWLREQTDLPICIGFGISGEEQVRQLRDVADGLIVGSAIVRRVTNSEGKSRAEVLQDVGTFVTGLLDALNPSA